MAMTPEILFVCGVLSLTTMLFITQVVRIDSAALLILAVLGAGSFAGPLADMVDLHLLYSGFSSNAVIAVLAVMIISAGLERTGALADIAAFCMNTYRPSPKRTLTILCISAGLLSAFMQNVAVVMLFLPLVAYIAENLETSPARFLIPVATCVILGGNITLIGSTPLIMLNDLVHNTNLADTADLTFTLFAPAPIGLALLAIGIVFFRVSWPYLWPVAKYQVHTESHQNYLNRVYKFDLMLVNAVVAANSAWIGQKVADVERQYGINILQFGRGHALAGRHLIMTPNTPFAMVCNEESLAQLEAEAHIRTTHTNPFYKNNHPIHGFVELVVLPDSDIIGQSARDIELRKTDNITLIGLRRGQKTVREDAYDTPLEAGDILLGYSQWKHIAKLDKGNRLAPISKYNRTEWRGHKKGVAYALFTAMAALLISGVFPPSLCLLMTAVAMIFFGIIPMQDALDKVSWKTIIFLACLVPLGQVMQVSGTADWMTAQFLDTRAWSAFQLQLLFMVLATVASMIISNIGATTILVPLAISAAMKFNLDPAVLVLTVGLGASNAFIIPTHQVNVLVASPGAYHARDFWIAGLPITIAYMAVSLALLNLLY